MDQQEIIYGDESPVIFNNNSYYENSNEFENVMENTVPFHRTIPTVYTSDDMRNRINQELHRLSIDLCDVLENGVLKYKCEFIFSGADLLLVTGNQLLSQDPDSISISLETEKLRVDDLFIKAGLFVRLLKHYLSSCGLGNIKKKYFETNTYVSTFRLGIKVNNARADSKVPHEKVARKVIYIKLRDSLEFVRKGLIGVTVQPIGVTSSSSSSTANRGPSFVVPAHSKTESLRQSVCLLANEVRTIEGRIAAYLKDKVQSPSLTYHSAEAIEILLSTFLTTSLATQDAEVINRIKERCQIEEELNGGIRLDEDGKMMMPLPVENSESTLEECCLEYLQEIKKRRLLG